MCTRRTFNDDVQQLRMIIIMILIIINTRVSASVIVSVVIVSIVIMIKTARLMALQDAAIYR